MQKCSSYALLCTVMWAASALGQIPVEAWPLKPPVIPDTVKVTADVKYGPNPQNVLDILEPKAPARGLRPGAIVIHGGGWTGGSRAWVAELVCLRFIEKGFVVANVEYRVARVATAPAAVVDVLQAAKWFMDNTRKYGVDPKRVVVTGDSAGGHLTLMVGMTPDSAGFGPAVRVRAVVNFFGITDLTDQFEGPNRKSYTVVWVPQQPGRVELARRVSPVTYVRKQLPPILTVHGTADPTVSYSQGRTLTEALNAAGARAALVSVTSGSHGFPKVQTDEIYDQYVWPFLRSTGVLKMRPLPPKTHSGALACTPRNRCGFAGVATAALSRTIVVNQKNTRASDRNPGTEARPLRTISAAAELAQPGDTVLVHSGIYRERVSPARGGEEGRPIIYAAATGEQVFVKGSEAWRPVWQSVAEHPGVWYGKLDPAMFGAFNPFHLDLNTAKKVRPAAQGATLPQTRGQLFVDGLPLLQAESAEQVNRTRGSWVVDTAGDGITVHFPPDAVGRAPRDRLVEITARSRIFGSVKRGLGYVHVKGFIFEHAANNHPTPQVGAVSLRSGHHWLIEDNVIRYATTIGLEAGMEWGIGSTDEDSPVPPDYVPSFNVIRNNHISDNGLCGIAALGHVGMQVIGNTLERNNRLAFRTWEVGGIKFHFAYYSLIEGNLIRDTDGFGIWMDNTFYKCRITRNVVVNNYLAGIFPELAEGPMLIDNNVIAYTRHGDGIYAHDASGFTIAHNLIYSNANYGVWTVIATDRVRPFGPAISSHQRIYNNVIFANHAGAIGLPFPFARAEDNLSDANLFMGDGSMDAESTGLAPSFRYHGSHNRVPKEKLTGALGAPRPDLTLDQWRALSGNDKGSLATSMSNDILGLHTLEVRFNFRRGGRTASEDLWKVRTVPVEGVEADFFGNPLPKEGALPGPFQSVAKGPNRWLLWPVTPLLKGYPMQPGETPKVQETFNEDVRVRHGCSQKSQ